MCTGGTDNNVEDNLFSRKHSYQLESETGNSVEGYTDVMYRDSSVIHSLGKQNPTGTFYKVSDNQLCGVDFGRIPNRLVG